MNLPIIIAVASGGAIGATLRLLLSTTMNTYYPHILPLGTLVVNLIGALLIGIFFAYFQTHTTLSPHTKAFISTGILGALTTYSTFAIESLFLLKSGDYVEAFANMALNLFGTIGFAAIGYFSIIYFTK